MAARILASRVVMKPVIEFSTASWTDGVVIPVVITPVDVPGVECPLLGSVRRGHEDRW